MTWNGAVADKAIGGAIGGAISGAVGESDAGNARGAVTSEVVSDGVDFVRHRVIRTIGVKAAVLPMKFERDDEFPALTTANHALVGQEGQQDEEEQDDDQRHGYA